ncbi:MAG TPA: hypothetical protein VFS39_03870 [Nitrospira sp.]|nr:hypothetical protein [Nitrospira sp.]
MHGLPSGVTLRTGLAVLLLCPMVASSVLAAPVSSGASLAADRDNDTPPSLSHPPVAEGVVDRYLLHPRGEVNGLLLQDGTQMHVTSRAARRLIDIVQPGDRVRIHGRRIDRLPLVEGDVIVNVTDGATLTVPYRLDLPIPPLEERPPVNEMKAHGTVRFLLYDHLKDDVNGVVLSDGTQVRLPPDVGARFPASLQPGMHLEVEGYGVDTPHGRVLEATAIGRKGRPLTYLDASTQELR